MAAQPLSALSTWAGGHRIGEIVDCPTAQHDEAIRRWIAPAEAARAMVPVEDCRLYF